MPCRRLAFTLIELLVVIAIIAILVATLFPVFALAKERARAVACLSNTRQLGLAITMYADDNDEEYPCSCPTGMGMTMTGNTQFWVDTVQPYVKSKGIFRCPDDGSPFWMQMDMTGLMRTTSYGWNGYFIPVQPPYYGVRMAQIATPTTCILLAELSEDLSQEYFLPQYWGNPSRETDVTRQMAEWDMMHGVPLTVDTDRHAQGSNYVFAEGHAKWQRFDQTWSQSVGMPPSINRYDPEFAGQ